MFQGLEVGCLVVSLSRGPAAVENPDPLECQGAQGGLMGFAFGALLPVVGSRPERSGNSEGRPFDEGLSEEGGTLPTPVDPGGFAATFGDGRDADISLEAGGDGVTLALLTEGGHEPGREDGAGGRQAVEDKEIGMRRGLFGDCLVEGLDDLERGAQLLDEGLDEERELAAGRWQDESSVRTGT